MPVFNVYPNADPLDGDELGLVWQAGSVKRTTAQEIADLANADPVLDVVREGFVNASLTTGAVPFKILVISTSIGGFGADPGLPWVHRLGGYLSLRYNSARARLQTVGQGLVPYTNNGTSAALGTGVGATARSIPDGTVITQTYSQADLVNSVLAVYATQVGGGTLEIRRNSVAAGSVSTNAAASHGNILASDVGLLVGGHGYTFGAVGGPVTLELIQSQSAQRTAGVECMLVSCSGNSIQDVLNNPNRALVMIDTYDPDLVIIDLGTLDNAAGIPADVALMQTAVESRLKVGATWIWAAPYMGAVTTYDDNRAVIDTCESLGITVLDFLEPVGNISNTYTTDGIHPMINDSEKMARYVFSQLMGADVDLAQMYGQNAFPLQTMGGIQYASAPVLGTSVAEVGGITATIPFPAVGTRESPVSTWMSSSLVGATAGALLGGRLRGTWVVGGAAGAAAEAFAQLDLVAGRGRLLQGGIAVAGTSLASPLQYVGSAEWNSTFALVTPQSTTVLRSAGTGTAPTSTGGTVSTPAPDGKGFYSNVVNVAGAASVAEIRLGAAMWRRGVTTDPYGGFFGHSRVTFPDVSYDAAGAGTGTRLIPLAFCSGNAAALYPVVRGGATACVLFTREHVDGGNQDANWQFVTNDGGVVPTVVDTGMVFIPGDVYSFFITVEPGGLAVFGQVDNVTAGTSAVVSSTTDLPGTATSLVLSAGLTVLEAVTVRNFRSARLYAEALRG